MGCPMMFTRGSVPDGGDQDTFGPPSAMFLPAPMALFGVLTAFMFGVMFGVMMGKKSAMMGGGGKPWMKRGMHHHHGYGAPACSDWHGSWSGEAPDDGIKE